MEKEMITKYESIIRSRNIIFPGYGARSLTKFFLSNFVTKLYIAL